MIWVFSMDIIEKTETLKELEKLADTGSASRISEFSKLAFSGMDRKSLNSEIAKAQRVINKARKEYQESSSQLSSLQSRVNSAHEALQQAASRLVILNKASRDLDLSGADAVSEMNDELAYVIDGKKVHVDTSDVNDIKITPWKEFLKNQKETLDESNNDDGQVFDLEEIGNMIDQKEEDNFEYLSDEPDFDPDFGISEAQIEKSIITKIAKKKFR
jgi:hypothetical protein